MVRTFAGPCLRQPQSSELEGHGRFQIPPIPLQLMTLRRLSPASVRMWAMSPFSPGRFFLMLAAWEEGDTNLSPVLWSAVSWLYSIRTTFFAWVPKLKLEDQQCPLSGLIVSGRSRAPLSHSYFFLFLWKPLPSLPSFPAWRFFL